MACRKTVQMFMNSRDNIVLVLNGIDREILCPSHVTFPSLFLFFMLLLVSIAKALFVNLFFVLSLSLICSGGVVRFDSVAFYVVPTHKRPYGTKDMLKSVKWTEDKSQMEHKFV